MIIAINGTETKDMADFLTTLWSHKVGEKVKIDYIFEKSPQITEVTLTKRPNDS